MATYDVLVRHPERGDDLDRYTGFSARKAVDAHERFEGAGFDVRVFDSATGKRVPVVTLVRIALGEVGS